jgi:hypothetical protein
MIQFNFYFYTALAAAGIFVSAYMIWHIFLVLREGKIPRRPGLKPVSPRDGAAIYWSYLAVSLLGAIIIAWGTVIVILRLVHSS